MGHWQQKLSANIGIRYTGGWCLQAVQNAFGTQHKYDSAYYDWMSGATNPPSTRFGNHDGGIPPLGIQVPVYLNEPNGPRDDNGIQQDDVAIWLSDGRVAAAAQEGSHDGMYIYPSLQAYIDDYSKWNGGVTYRGWSEGTADTAVVTWVEDPAPVVVSDNATPDQIRQDYLEILERGADDGGIEHYQNFTNDFVRADLYNSDEYKRLQASKIVPVAVPEPPVVIPELQPELEPVIETPVVVEPVKEPTNIIITSKPYVDNPTYRYMKWYELVFSYIIKLINKLRGIK